MKKDSDIICFCEEVTYGEIKNAIKNGTKTVEALGDELDAGITCGTCIEELEEILEEE